MKTSILESKYYTLELLKKKCKYFTILYVEDEEKVRVQTSKMLHIFFDNIVQAKNGKDALKKTQETNFDIIFTDIKMPIMDGLDMIKEIRKQGQTLPIIVFSAYDDKEYLLKSIEYNIDGYILKPFRFDAIHNLIEKTINKKYSYKKTAHTLDLVNKFHWHNETNSLYKEHKKIILTKHETILFKLLASSINRIFTNEEIEIELFDDEYSDTKRVRSLISRLKTKLRISLIKSFYSQGYKLNMEKLC